MPRPTRFRRSSSTSRTARRDGTAVRDSRRQPYLAGFGYAAVRVDMRGTGRQRRRHHRRVHAAGAGRRRRDPRLDRRSSRGATGSSACGASPGAASTRSRSPLGGPRARRDHDPLLDGRPLRGRRPLPRRLRPRARHAPLGVVDADVERAAARPAPLRRRLAGGPGSAARLDSRRGSSPGSRTSAATRTGSTAPSARTTPRSSAPSTPSAASPTATRTRSRGSSRGSPSRARG